MTIEAEEFLDEYLERAKPKDWPRFTCCNSSRSFYCPDCCRILIPSDDWPCSLREGRLRFPFDVDILLGVKERRTSATGIHVAAIFNSMASSGCAELKRIPEGDPKPSAVRLYDLNRGEIPSYEPNEPGTYVLFPDKDSVPITSVASEIRKLIVLDVKWTRRRIRVGQFFDSLPKVHLVDPPAESRYWRWHNSGKGMLSSVEALYYATLDVASSWTKEEREEFVDMMWLFALQRCVINERSELEQRPAPFREEGKRLRRILRYQPNKPLKNKTEEEN